MSDHNPRERRLFRDLQEKSVLTRQVQRLAGSMRRLQARAAKRRSNRWRARYTNSVRRAAAKVEELEQQVLSRAQELEAMLQWARRHTRALLHGVPWIFHALQVGGTPVSEKLSTFFVLDLARIS
mgnify:CR=1 FL=1